MFHNFFHRRKLFSKVTTELSIIRLIFAVGLAGIETIWSLYLDSYGLSESFIGFFAAGLVLFSLLFSLYSTVILEKFSEYKVLIYSLLAISLSYFLIYLFGNLYVFIGVSIFLTFLMILRIESFDILFRDSSNDKDLNKDEGFLFAIVNIGWLIGPLIAGYFMLKYGVSSVFLVSSLFILFAVILLIKLNLYPKEKKRDKIDSNLKENFLDFVRNKKLRLPYMIASGIEIWWALIYIYTPLFIIKSGLEEDVVGIFLALVVIPLVFFEFEVGKLSEKFGYRNFFVSGFFLLGVLAFMAFLFNFNIYVLLALLVIASIPMSFLEPLQDSYFFRQIKSNEEEKYYPIYATAGDMGSFLGKGSVALFLLFLPQEFSFMIIGFFMFLIAFFCLKIKK